MSKILWKSLLAAPAILGAALAGSAIAAEVAPVQEAASVDALEQVSFEQEPVQLAQITSVSQLSDVLPSDWAFQALQNLVDNYGCIQGYPDRTYRGQAAMTRFEFAAGLNSCLDVIAQLIATGINPDDLATIQRLQEEFQAELNTLRGRVDALEADVAELEANQFSTTTKLRGQVDFHLGVPFDAATYGGLDEFGIGDTSTTFVSRARLNFDTSFTGEDRLRIRLQASSGNDPFGLFGGWANASGVGDSTLDVRVDDFFYSFPIGSRIDVTLAANGFKTDDWVTSTIVPFDGPSVADAGGPLIYDAGMGPSGAGVGFNWAFTDSLVLDAGYTVSTSGAANPTVGIFQGTKGEGASQSYIAQLSWLSDGFLDLGAVYMHSDGGLELGGTGKSLNSYAGLINLDFGGFEIGGYAGITDPEGSGDVFNWLAGVAFNDLFFDGAQLGIYGGQTPLNGVGVGKQFIAEAYYDIPFNEFLTITPAVVYGDLNVGLDNESTIYGVIRTTFRF